MNSKYPKSFKDSMQIRKTLKEAFTIWQEGSVLKFKELNDSNADIIIKFEKGAHDECPGYSFTGRGGLLGKTLNFVCFVINIFKYFILAHAWPPRGIGINGDIHFDDDEPWDFYGNKSGPESELKDFFSVAFHEIGHSLGLGHSTNSNAVMSANYIKLQRKLHLDDILGLQQMYGIIKPKLSSGRKRPTVVPITTTTKVSIQQSRTPYGNQTRTQAPTKPTNCNKSYDVIAMIQDEVVIIKGRLVWRLKNGNLLIGYPKEIDNVWHKFPKRILHIDALFENKKQHKIWIFVGQRIFIYDGFELKFVKMLIHLGLPANLKKVDSIFTTGHDKRTYILSGQYYWK